MRDAPRTFLVGLVSLGVAVAASNAVSCKGGSEDGDAKPYFDRTIAPVLQGSCSRQTTGCHLVDARGNALGNLDTSSFDALDRRRDLLVTYGPYNSPGLLAKVAGPQSVPVSTLDGTIAIVTDIRHAAGAGIDVTSDGYATLRRWMDSGATRNNVGPSAPRVLATGNCKPSVPSATGFDPAVDPPGFSEFVATVQPVLKKSCSAGTCHGNDVADLSLTCGDTPEQQRWNAWIAAQFIAKAPEGSELVRRPLDPAAGGVYHEGGVVFAGTDDGGYKAILAWAKSRGAPDTTSLDEGLKYFANRVQPVMVRKGCMFLGCHSPSMFHDLRLAGGSGGQFSLAATKRNYEMSRLMLATEAPDPNVSRLIKKNLFSFDREVDPTSLGTRHRGGPLLEDVPGISEARAPKLEDCKSFDLDKGDLNTIPGWCIFARWHEVERAAAMTAGPAMGGVDAEPLRAIAYVSRPPNTDVPQAFDTYRPGASLHLVAATLPANAATGANGAPTLGTDDDKTSACGLSTATADIRGPAVSWDGTKIAFAARASADTPLAIYVLSLSGGGGASCTKHDKVSAHDAKQNGILVHDFDPAWAPDGRLVFASTRGAIGQSDVDYSGPTKTPSMLLPNSNIYVLEADGTIRQLSFLLNAELSPTFMNDGRLIFTTEKRAPGFYQLAARRQNLDGGDYHPHFAQRKSLGFEQMTEVVELTDRNFAAIVSDKGALAGAGAIAVLNRSLGPDQELRDPADRFYLKALHLSDANANGKKGSVASYRSPAALPSHLMLVSYAGADPYAFDGGFDLVALDPRSGARTPLLTRASGQSIVDAVAVYARPNHGVFDSRLDEVNGATQVEKGARDATAHVLDLGLLGSLLFENTREGRKIDPNHTGVGVLESLPPPNDATSFDAIDQAFVASDAYGKLWAKRRRLGATQAFDDHSVAFRIPGGMPFVLELYSDPRGAPLATQKEEMQLVPGERARVGFRRDLFGAQCGGCHGSISGREVDVHLVPDVLTSASRVEAMSKEPVSWAKPPAERGAPFGAK